MFVLLSWSVKETGAGAVVVDNGEVQDEGRGSEAGGWKSKALAWANRGRAALLHHQVRATPV